MKVVVECPGSVMNAQNNRRQAISGWASCGRHFPVGKSEHDLDEGVVKKMQAEKARGESVLTVTVVEAPKPQQVQQHRR